MLFPLKMCKARIIGLRREEHDFVRALHEFGIVEIKEFSDEKVQKEFSQEHFEQVAEELLKVESALKMIPNTGIKKTRELISFRHAIKEAKKIGFHESLLDIRQKKE